MPDSTVVAGPVSDWRAISFTGAYASLVQISATLPIAQPTISPPMTDAARPHQWSIPALPSKNA